MLHLRMSVALLILVLLMGALGVAVLAWFALPRANTVVLGSVEEFPVRAEPYPFAAGETHGFIAHMADGWVAYDAVTPHLTRCRVLWVEQNGRLEDPCSGSRFDAMGRYVFGPALRRLDRYTLKVTRDGRVVVDLSRELPVSRAEWIAECEASRGPSESPGATSLRTAQLGACAQALDQYPGYLTQY